MGDGDTGAAREAKGIGWNLLTLILQATVPTIHVQLARFLGAGGYGLYTWSNIFVDTFSIITLFGMDQAVQRQVALATDAAGDDREKAVRAVGTALRVVLTSGAVVALLLIFLAPAVASFQGKPGLVPPLRFLALVPIFYHGTTIFIVATQSRHVMRWGFWARGVIQPLSLLLITSIVLRAGGGPGAAGAAVAAGMGLTCLASAIFYARELPLGATLRAMIHGPVDWGTVRLAIPLVATNVVWALHGRVDAFFLEHFRGSDEMGSYSACVLYVLTMDQIRGAFAPGVCALIPPALAKGAVKELTLSIQRQTRWVALLVLPLLVLFAGFGDGLLVVFGKDFILGSRALTILALGHTVGALALSGFVLPMSGNARYSTLTGVLSVGLQCVMLPALVQRWGLTGAAISASSSIVFAQTLQMTFAYRLTKVHGLSWGLLRVAGAAAVAFVVGRLVFESAWSTLVARFFVGVAVAALTYLLLIFAFGLGTEERQVVRATARRLLRKAPV